MNHAKKSNSSQIIIYSARYIQTEILEHYEMDNNSDIPPYYIYHLH